MHEYMNFLVIALVVLGYGYFSKLLLRYNISGPMIFVAVGVLLSPLGFGPSETKLNAELVQITAEFALILILFSDASALNLRKLRHEWSIPVRLLFVSLFFNHFNGFHCSVGFHSIILGQFRDAGP